MAELQGDGEKMGAVPGFPGFPARDSVEGQVLGDNKYDK